MSMKFIETVEIKQIGESITDLKNRLNESEEKLKKVTQKEIEKQFGLVEGKTIIKEDNGGVYVYMGIEHSYYSYSGNFYFYVLGSKINKNEDVSKLKKVLRGDWEKTDKEYKG